MSFLLFTADLKVQAILGNVETCIRAFGLEPSTWNFFMSTQPNLKYHIAPGSAPLMLLNALELFIIKLYKKLVDN